ncbi:hypothetical protein A3J41_01285 [candidate division TM6 bacterium RIFCSPHIGHO2_12_FULL_38_8]|nr:MAG: hypothetical protein A3J41_01285 [candidate division TM6 bacterium RIFCSPHIGHO2_12_FULL_38_8]
MIFFDSIRDFIRNLSRQEMIKWGSLYVGICVIGMIIIIVRHNMQSNEWYTKIKQLNKARSTVQQVFTKFNIVQQQKNKVDEALKANKNFNIQKYFQDLLAQQNLSAQTTAKFSYEKLPNGYTQESLLLNISQISTQQLCQLIAAIENQPLVYITTVDIAHMIQAKKINVTMTAATLRAEE